MEAEVGGILQLVATTKVTWRKRDARTITCGSVPVALLLPWFLAASPRPGNSCGVRILKLVTI